MVEASLNSAHQWALCLAASSQHSRDCLFALPITLCGLKLDDKVVRVAVGLRLGLNLCISHDCYCGSLVDARGLHGFVCRKARGRLAGRDALNDLVAGSFDSAGISIMKEPSRVFQIDGK